ncbi:hypothetical protein [Flavobacteriaceae bacterium 14752]|uniref:hypothetical protein n=1 Tax=Mesohalobacter salilacus TaxID=2491711 RepID=UPI000F6384CD|nr:hypothetical protein EIG84_01155 [Flavobacteriaceae bacterium 14752]
MKISQTEHNIKKDLAQRELQPSQNLWDDIEQELDKSTNPQKQKLWLKYVSIAAVLCIGIFVYQGLNSETVNPTQLVLESKPIIEQDIQLKLTPTTFSSYVASPSTVQTKNISNVEAQVIENYVPIKNTIVDEEKPSIDIEVNNLLSQAQNTLAEAEKEKQLRNEVNALLANAIQQTQDEEQKQILQNLQATTLLAEIEAEIELQKPQKLKDKIWEALVSNLNDIKQVVALN